MKMNATKFAAFNAEMNKFIMGEWATMTDVAARSARVREIEAKHNFRNGWIDGECMETAFSNERHPRFPADQGCSD